MLTSMLQRCIFRSALEETGRWGGGRHSKSLSRGVSVASFKPTAVSATHPIWATETDRKSTRLNSSHTVISYAVFCLKKKKKTQTKITQKENTTLERQ